ncbi:hypothetical protein ACFC58_07155 [Kitasatospora purpeofusca]|uniref:hypothetical protein n=1 Tax=Kitasatospora purpeofusca TaxID=67352 RepID=UPI0035E04C77
MIKPNATVGDQPVPTDPARRRRRSPRVNPQQPPLPLADPLSALSSPLSAVRDLPGLDDVAERYPDRKVSVSARHKPLEIYSGKPNQQGSFALDSQEFFLVISQFFREALPLRIIILMIACQRAGGQIELTQEEMGTVLDITRPKINEALKEIMEHGILFKKAPGVYQFNPPYSYRVAEFIPATDGQPAQMIRVEQADRISEIRGDAGLPDRVRFPSLDAMRTAIEELRKERAAERAARAAKRKAAEKDKGKAI